MQETVQHHMPNFKLPLDKKISNFSALVNCMISKSMHELKLDELMVIFVTAEKESTKILEILDKDELNCQHMMRFQKALKHLVLNSIKYKKYEAICHQLSAIQYLIKTYNFKAVLDEMQEILTEEENVERKLYLTEKLFESLKFMAEKITAFVQKMESEFGSVSKLIFQNTPKFNDDDAEKMLYSYLVDSVIQLKEIWSQWLTSFESSCIYRQKIEQIDRVGKRYDELFGIHQYINTISIADVIYKAKEGSIHDQSSHDYSYLFRQETKAARITDDDGDEAVWKYLSELEFVIKKLGGILDSRIENESNCDIFSNEMVVMYATALLDNCYLKKMLLILSKSIYKNFVKKSS